LLYRNLGKTDEKVSILGFGCMRLPILDGNPEKINEPLATQMIHHAIDEGVNYMDTAYPYHGTNAYHGGMSEIFLGNVLNDGYRDDVKISTKLPSWMVQKKEDLNYFLDEQLKRLKTDRIDFYLLHGLHQDFWQTLTLVDVFDFLDSAIDDGKIGYAGFSFHDELEFFKIVVDSYDWSFAQVQLNYMDQDFQAGQAGVDYAAAKGLGTVIMEPLRGGCLTNNVPSEVQKIWDSSEVKRSPAEWALRYLWNQEQIDVVLSGMTTMEQLNENLEIASHGLKNSLTESELDLYNQVKDIYTERIHVGCTGCNYCMPCEMGVDIPLNLNLLNDVYMYENMEKPTGNYKFLTAKKMSADYCNECGECEKRCTQNIPIVQFMQETKNTFK
jgi:predicted aldo/keto reductase-like oxidoreductase